MLGKTNDLLFGVLRKAASIALAAFVILSLNFAAYWILQDDPPVVTIGSYGPPTEYWEFIEDARLNESLAVQYIDYLADTVKGDLRSSIVHRGEITDFIWHPVWNTLVLLTIGLLGSLAVGSLLERLARGGKAKWRAWAVHGVSIALLLIPTISVAVTLAKANIAWDIGLPIGRDGNMRFDGGSLAYSIVTSAVLPILTVLLSSIPLAIMIFREGLMKSGVSRPVKGPWLATFASGLVRLRPMAHFHVAWTMSIVLIVDVLFVYEGLGTLMLETLVQYDTPVLMATTLIVPVIVLLFASTLSLSLHLLTRRGLQDALGDWGRRDPAPAQQVRPVTREAAKWTAWAMAVWKSFRSSRTSMAAAALLVVIIALGALAPILATVPDPASSDYWIFRPDTGLPLPPSLESSPLTGHVHPFGTDFFARDVYSMMLYAIRYAATIMVGLVLATVAIGSVLGILASNTAGIEGLPARILDFLFTAFARAFVVIPLFVLVIMRWYSIDDWVVGILGILVAAFYAWAWLLIARPVRAATRAAGEGAGMRQITPSVLAESLSVAKFAVPFVMMTMFNIHAVDMGGVNAYDWGVIMDNWYQGAVTADGCWILVILPALGVLSVCGGVFVFLDRVEHAVRTTASYPSKK